MNTLLIIFAVLGALAVLVVLAELAGRAVTAIQVRRLPANLRVLIRHAEGQCTPGRCPHCGPQPAPPARP